MKEEIILENKFIKEYEYPKFLFAGFGSRFAAFIIDLLTISFISKILVIPISSIFDITKSKMFFGPYNLMLLGIYLGYFFFLTYINNGQTIGKMILGIKVISLNDEKLNITTVFYREVLGRFILKKLGIFYLMMLFNRNKQQLADFFANTSVVNTEYFYEYLKLKEKAEQDGSEVKFTDKEVLIAGDELEVNGEDENNLV